jgi:adenylate cyclase
MEHAPIAQGLVAALGRAAEEPSFLPLMEGIHEALVLAGVDADRIQLPMARSHGFRHPTLGLLLLTWTREDGTSDSESMTHAQLDRLTLPGVVGTPFEHVVLHGAPPLRLHLDQDAGGFGTLERLRDRGFRDYCAMGIPMPSGIRQPLSLCTRGSFPEDLPRRLQDIEGLLGLAIYGAYRTSQAMRMAEVYIGPQSGPRVLAGEIQRGSTRRIEAGIVFCDVRGFTALSERLGAERVVAVVNRVFEAVEDEARPRGGEILKFIGDAILLVFPVASPEQRASVCGALVETARRSLAAVEVLGEELSLPLGIGFGGHLGEVVQGNVGTPERLDFTVMGPAVNLASRLEGLCKPLRSGAVFSEAVAEHVPGLSRAGAHELKGLPGPVGAWVL